MTTFSENHRAPLQFFKFELTLGVKGQTGTSKFSEVVGARVQSKLLGARARAMRRMKINVQVCCKYV